MSYSFASASSQYLVNTSQAAPSLPLTMACWFQTATDAANQTLMSFGSSASNNPYMVLQAAMNQAGDPVRVYHRDNAATEGIAEAGTISLSTWSHAAGVWAASNSRTAYLNGTAGSANTTSNSTTTTTGMAIGALYRATPAAFMNGLIGDAAVWNVALTAAEIAILAKGFSPLCLTHRIQNLIHFKPLIRTLNDGWSRGATLTNTNGATAAAHNRIIWPQ